MQQIGVLKRAFVSPEQISEGELAIFTEPVRSRIRSGEIGIPQDFREKLETLAVLAEFRDDATGEHAYRVGRVSALMLERLGGSQDDVSAIEIGARLHDIGKLGVPDIVLRKHARLTLPEMDLMRRHAAEGYEILSSIGHPLFELAAQIAFAHHEWWDGTGYPRRISGVEIRREARIAALADVFDALTHERPYKRAWPVEIALEEIASLSGRQFDPELCELFLHVMNELHAEHGARLDDFLGQAARKSELVTAHRFIDSAANPEALASRD